MNRTLGEILNTPIELKEGMRVFSLYSFKFGVIEKGSGDEYPFCVMGDEYTVDGKYKKKFNRRHLLAEQEAYELFPSLKPKIYEYQVVFKTKDREGIHLMSGGFYTSPDEFLKINNSVNVEDAKLYQPSKRERKSWVTGEEIRRSLWRA